MQQHPLSCAFPRMTAADYQALQDSIAELGVQNPITLLDGMVLDGWHRYSAALALGLPCPSAELAGWIDPREYVMAQNKTRRHITQAQLALAATAVYAWHPVGANQHRQNREVTQCPPCPGKTNAELAAIAGAGISTVKQAKVVHANATEQVQDAVRRGDIGLPKAAAIARLPRQQQAGALAKPLPKPPTPEPQEPEAPPPDDYTELDAARDQITALQDALAVALMVSPLDADQQQAAQRMAELQAEVKTLQATLKAVTLSRDTLMEERAQMLRQLKSQRSEIERLKKH